MEVLLGVLLSDCGSKLARGRKKEAGFCFSPDLHHGFEDMGGGKPNNRHGGELPYDSNC